jgi:hypothetical protein
MTEEAGSDNKRRPILLLILALHQASRIVNNYNAIRVLAEYLGSYLKKAPTLFSTVLTAEISEGTLKNKDMVYFLANTFTEVVKWSPETVKYICASLAEIRDTNKELLVDSLVHVIDAGPHASLHPLNLIFMSLVSALYIENNHLTVTYLLNFFTTLRAYGEQDTIIRGLTHIEDGTKNPNGIAKNNEITNFIKIESRVNNPDIIDTIQHAAKSNSHCANFLNY